MNDQDIITLCQRHGLEVLETRLTSGLLELIPADLASIPSAERLEALARELKQGDVRWVTLAVEEAA